ncbi:response regulator [Aquimarina rubra]|uniref:Response regulator n=1 Tax=Aquimarina rubra TaxID=1920033 RepID=A0ABW5L8R9_9FLAO
MGKIKQVLLVDDSRATNFFNKTIIKKTDCVQEVLVAENGEEAIQFIKSGNVPEVIFLDINMPIMNGWEFLSEVQKFDKELTKTVVVLMIGAALNPEEEKLAYSFPYVKEFKEKMLTTKTVKEIVEKYFHKECKLIEQA